MAIMFNKLISLMQERGESIYHLTRYKVIGKATLDKLRKNDGLSHVDTRTINAICGYLNCQPGDIMEFVPDSDLNT